MYQVFPGNFSQWESLFFKACKLGEIDIVEKMVVFFRDKRPGFINAKEKKTGNTALHMAARNGHYVRSSIILTSPNFTIFSIV